MNRIYDHTDIRDFQDQSRETAKKISAIILSDAYPPPDTAIIGLSLNCTIDL